MPWRLSSRRGPRLADARTRRALSGGRCPAAVVRRRPSWEPRAARDFARELTGLLDAAQSARRFTVEILIKPAYAQVDDLQDVFDTISGIAVRLANGLPHRSSAVGQVIVVVEGRPMVRRVIKLH